MVQSLTAADVHYGSPTQPAAQTSTLGRAPLGAKPPTRAPGVMPNSACLVAGTTVTARSGTPTASAASNPIRSPGPDSVPPRASRDEDRSVNRFRESSGGNRLGRNLVIDAPSTFRRVAPAVPFGPSTNVRRRRRDLVVGVTIGAIVTVILCGYFLIYRQAAAPVVIAPRQPDRIMTLTVTPPWATVMLDGRVLGQPDASGKLEISVPGGESAVSWLEVSAEGYHGIRRPLSSYSGTQDVTIELIRMPYEVAVRTMPPKAEIWIDNELKGYSPLRLTLLPTENPTITAKREGCKPVSRQVTAPDKGGLVEVDLSLDVANVVVQVESEPPGAMIAMDGILRGPAPLAVEMDPSYLGKDVQITATLEGYERASTQVALPAKAGDGPIPARLPLVRRKAEVELWTTPPGGYLVMDGRDLGPAPVAVKFEPTQIGTTTIVTASLAGTHYGRYELTIPPIGEPLRVTIPMDFNVRKVVVVVSCPTGGQDVGLRGTDSGITGSGVAPKAKAGVPSPADASAQAETVVLADQAVEVIHSLNAEQRFALLVDTDDGVEVWPGAVETEVASDEQKVRAYDMIRSARSPSEGRVAEAIRASLEFQPDTIWLFAGGKLAQEDLEQLNDWSEDRDVALHIVRGSTEADDAWLREWATDHRGTVSVLGRDHLPDVALGQGEE